MLKLKPYTLYTPLLLLHEMLHFFNGGSFNKDFFLKIQLNQYSQIIQEHNYVCSWISFVFMVHFKSITMASITDRLNNVVDMSIIDPYTYRGQIALIWLWVQYFSMDIIFLVGVRL